MQIGAASELQDNDKSQGIEALTSYLFELSKSPLLDDFENKLNELQRLMSSVKLPDALGAVEPELAATFLNQFFMLHAYLHLYKANDDTIKKNLEKFKSIFKASRPLVHHCLQSLCQINAITMLENDAIKDLYRFAKRVKKISYYLYSYARYEDTLDLLKDYPHFPLRLPDDLIQFADLNIGNNREDISVKAGHESEVRDTLCDAELGFEDKPKICAETGFELDCPNGKYKQLLIEVDGVKFHEDKYDGYSRQKMHHVYKHMILRHAGYVVGRIISGEKDDLNTVRNKAVVVSTFIKMPIFKQALEFRIKLHQLYTKYKDFFAKNHTKYRDVQKVKMLEDLEKMWKLLQDKYLERMTTNSAEMIKSMGSNDNSLQSKLMPENLYNESQERLQRWQEKLQLSQNKQKKRRTLQKPQQSQSNINAYGENQSDVPNDNNTNPTVEKTTDEAVVKATDNLVPSTETVKPMLETHPLVLRAQNVLLASQAKEMFDSKKTIATSDMNNALAVVQAFLVEDKSKSEQLKTACVELSLLELQLAESLADIIKCQAKQQQLEGLYEQQNQTREEREAEINRLDGELKNLHQVINNAKVLSAEFKYSLNSNYEKEVARKDEMFQTFQSFDKTFQNLKNRLDELKNRISLSQTKIEKLKLQRQACEQKIKGLSQPVELMRAIECLKEEPTVTTDLALSSSPNGQFVCFNTQKKRLPGEDIHKYEKSSEYREEGDKRNKHEKP